LTDLMMSRRIALPAQHVRVGHSAASAWIDSSRGGHCR
jgi:hypothetical protein